MAYTKYSLTPANNTAAPPDGAPEGMLPSAVNDTMRDMMAQIRDVGDGVRDGTYTMTAPKITGGTITGVTLTGNTLTNPVITGATLTTSAFNGTVGATTASTGAFTTLSTSSTTTLSGLTASTALALDASKNVVSVTNTGTGNNVLSASPTLTGTIAGASLSLSSLTSGRVTYAGASGLLTDSATLQFNANGLGIGAAPNTSPGSPYFNLNVGGGGGGGIISSGEDTYFTSNLYITGGANYFAVTGPAYGSYYNQSNGNHLWLSSTAAGAGGTVATVTEKMRITSAGNVGIGTSSPSTYKFEVLTDTVGENGAIIRNVNTADNAATILRLYAGTNTSAIVRFPSTHASKANELYITNVGTTSPITFATQDTERMRIDSSGNLLVGTTNTVIWNTTNTGVVVGGVSAPAIQISRNADACLLLNRIGNDGDVAIFARQGLSIGSISVTSALVSYNVSSDYRLKEDITTMTGALAKVAQLNPVTYKWKVNGSDGQGFIAHELQAVVPDCVTGEKDAIDEDGKPVYQQMDASFLIATLTAAIQELKAEFDAYKATHP